MPDTRPLMEQSPAEVQSFFDDLLGPDPTEVACPRCKAPADEVCESPSGEAVDPHPERVQARSGGTLDLNALSEGYCPQCRTRLVVHEDHGRCPEGHGAWASATAWVAVVVCFDCRPHLLQL